MRAEQKVQQQYRCHGHDGELKILARRTTLFTALSLCLVAGIQNADAQSVPSRAGAASAASQPDDSKPGDKKAADDKTVNMETVTVTGIVGSLNRTIDAKRSETAVVDAISAEDVGKFPDTNVADSLQHITGVEITRDNNGEGQYVTVRGLPTDLTLATLNGLSATSTTLGNRTFDFNLISPDFIQTLKVYKSSRADLDEGGIAANVDIQTVTPFGIGKERAVFTAKMQGAPGESSNRNYPDIDGLYSNVFADGTFGVTVGFDWNKRFYLNQESDPSPFYGVTINGKGPYYAYSETGYSNEQSKVDTRTAYASLQWKPVDSTTATLTALYADRKNFYATADFGVVPLEPFGQPTYNGPGADSTVDGNGVFTRLNTPVVAWTYYNTYSQEQSKLKNLRLKVESEIGNWTFTETAQYSKSTDDLHWVRPLLINSSVGGQTPTPGATIYGGYTATPGSALQGYILDPSMDMTNPASWANQQFKDYTQSGSDTLKSLQADITRHIDDSVIESVQFGVKAYERPRTNAQEYWVYAFAPGSTQYPFSTAVQYPSWTQNVLDNYSGGGVRPSNLFFINPNLWMNQYFGSEANFRKAATVQNNPAGYWGLTERGRDAYAMANFKFDGNVPVTGNIGVRYVNTKEEFRFNGYNPADIQLPDCVLGTAGCETLTYPPISPQVARTGSHEWLPSLNVSAEVREDMNIRLAASKTISLPTLNQMIPGYSFTADIKQATGGNPGLQPFSSQNFDLSWEWYFRPSAMFSLAVYDKEISGFIRQGTGSILVGQAPNQAVFKTLVPVNGADAYVRGVEADYKEVLDFLPGVWSGLGFEVNATYSKGQQEASPQYNVVATPFPGLSKLTYNASLFYEKYGFSGLITVNHRGSYVADPDIWGYGTTKLIGASRTQVDAQAAYQFTDYLTAFVDVKNLFNKPINYWEELSNGPTAEYPGQWQNNGRRVMVGVTVKY